MRTIASLHCISQTSDSELSELISLSLSELSVVSKTWLSSADDRMGSQVELLCTPLQLSHLPLLSVDEAGETLPCILCKNVLKKGQHLVKHMIKTRVEVHIDFAGCLHSDEETTGTRQWHGP